MTMTMTMTATPTGTATSTATMTGTATSSTTQTSTGTSTATGTSTPSNTVSGTGTPSNTASQTASGTPSFTTTASGTQNVTAAFVVVPTAEPLNITAVGIGGGLGGLLLLLSFCLLLALLARRRHHPPDEGSKEPTVIVVETNNDPGAMSSPRSAWSAHSGSVGRMPHPLATGRTARSFRFGDNASFHNGAGLGGSARSGMRIEYEYDGDAGSVTAGRSNRGYNGAVGAGDGQYTGRMGTGSHNGPVGGYGLGGVVPSNLSTGRDSDISTGDADAVTVADSAHAYDAGYEAAVAEVAAALGENLLALVPRSSGGVAMGAVPRSMSSRSFGAASGPGVGNGMTSGRVSPGREGYATGSSAGSGGGGLAMGNGVTLTHAEIDAAADAASLTPAEREALKTALVPLSPPANRRPPIPMGPPRRTVGTGGGMSMSSVGASGVVGLGSRLMSRQAMAGPPMMFETEVDIDQPHDAVASVFTGSEAASMATGGSDAAGMVTSLLGAADMLEQLRSLTPTSFAAVAAAVEDVDKRGVNAAPHALALVTVLSQTTGGGFFSAAHDAAAAGPPSYGGGTGGGNGGGGLGSRRSSGMGASFPLVSGPPAAEDANRVAAAMLRARLGVAAAGGGMPAGGSAASAARLSRHHAWDAEVTVTAGSNSSSAFTSPAVSRRGSGYMGAGMPAQASDNDRGVLRIKNEPPPQTWNPVARASPSAASSESGGVPCYGYARDHDDIDDDGSAASRRHDLDVHTQAAAGGSAAGGSATCSPGLAAVGAVRGRRSPRLGADDADDDDNDVGSPEPDAAGPRSPDALDTMLEVDAIVSSGSTRKRASVASTRGAKGSAPVTSPRPPLAPGTRGAAAASKPIAGAGKFGGAGTGRTASVTVMGAASAQGPAGGAGSGARGRSTEPVRSAAGEASASAEGGAAGAPASRHSSIGPSRKASESYLDTGAHSWRQAQAQAHPQASAPAGRSGSLQPALRRAATQSMGMQAAGRRASDSGVPSRAPAQPIERRVAAGTAPTLSSAAGQDKLDNGGASTGNGSGSRLVDELDAAGASVSRAVDVGTGSPAAHASSARGGSSSSSRDFAASPSARPQAYDVGVASSRNAVTAAALLEELAQDVLGTDHDAGRTSRTAAVAATTTAVDVPETSSAAAVATRSGAVAADSLQATSQPASERLHPTPETVGAVPVAPADKLEPEPEVDTIEALFCEVAAGGQVGPRLQPEPVAPSRLSVPNADHHEDADAAASASTGSDDSDSDATTTEGLGRRGGGHHASVLSLVDDSESEPMAVSELLAAATESMPLAASGTGPQRHGRSTHARATVTVLSHVQTAALSPAAASAVLQHEKAACAADNSAVLADGSEWSLGQSERAEEAGSTTGSVSAPSSQAASPMAVHLAGNGAYPSLCGVSECSAPSVAGSVSGCIDSRRSSAHYQSHGQADTATAGSAREHRAAQRPSLLADASDRTAQRASMTERADDASGMSSESGTGRAGDGSSNFGFEERDVTASAAARALSAGAPPVSPAAAPASPHRRTASAGPATPTGGASSSSGFGGKRNSAQPVLSGSVTASPHPPAQAVSSELPSLGLSSISRPSRRASGMGLSRFRVLPSMMFAKTGAEDDDSDADGASAGAAKGAVAVMGTGPPVKTQPGAQSAAGSSRLLPQLMAPHRPSGDPPAPLSVSSAMLSPSGSNSLGSRRNMFRPTLAEGAAAASGSGSAEGRAGAVGAQALSSPSKARGRTGFGQSSSGGGRGLRLLPSMMFAAPGAVDDSNDDGGDADGDDEGAKSGSGAGAVPASVRVRPAPPQAVTDAGAAFTVSSSQATLDRRASWRGRASAAGASAAGTKGPGASAVAPLALSPSGSESAGFNMPASPVHSRPWLPPGVASPLGDGPLSARSRGDSDEKAGRARRSRSPIPRPDASLTSMTSFRIVPVQHESPWRPPGAGTATFASTMTDASATEHRSSSVTRASARSAASAVAVSPASETSSPTRSPAPPRRADPSPSPAASAPAPVRKLPSASLIVGGFIPARGPAPTLPASTATPGQPMTQP